MTIVCSKRTIFFLFHSLAHMPSPLHRWGGWFRYPLPGSLLFLLLNVHILQIRSRIMLSHIVALAFYFPQSYPLLLYLKFPVQQKKRNAVNSTFLLLLTNAGDRNRTGTVFLQQDFKSCASASSATPAIIL